MGRIFSKLIRQTPGDPRVPQELVDEILDHLAKDTATLHSCSLVAKSWIYPSRRHLFNILFLTANDITKWNNTFPNPEDSPAGHVKDLSFCFIQSNAPINFAGRMPYFFNVQQLTLIGRVATDPSFISALGPLPPTIRSVDITFSKVLTAHIVSVVRQLPNLDNLSLTSTEWSGAIPTGTGKLIQARLSGKLRLRRKLAHCDILNMLMEVPTGPQFAEVEIRDASMTCFPASLKLVRACRDTLTKLHFSTLVQGSSLFLACVEFIRSNLSEQFSIDKSFDFAHCARMREVDLGAVFTSGRLQWITQALSTLNPGKCPLLSAVTLRLSVTLSLNGPVYILGQEISHDLSSIGHEIVRIKNAYTRKMNINPRCDLAFRTILSSQPIWHDLIREELPT